MEQFAIPGNFEVFPSPGTPISRLAAFRRKDNNFLTTNRLHLQEPVLTIIRLVGTPWRAFRTVEYHG
jgi:hypothetical protein